MSSGGLSDSSIGGGGDWICSDVTCHHLNFARRTKCNKCNRARSVDNAHQPGKSGSSSSKKKLGTEIGKAAAEKSRGLFSAEDWQCSKCANVNWARRQTCNMCNAPRFCDIEERTGYGGGYNDRGIVEYKQREESDSEYDEFGRLKKRKKGKIDQSCDGNNKRTDNKRGQMDDEDEEDDEDDENLAKYDLFGDEHDFPTDEKKQVEINNKVACNNITKRNGAKKGNDSSHSRSRSHTRSRSHYSHSQSSSNSNSKSSSSFSSRYRSRSRSRSCSRSRSRSRSAANLRERRSHGRIRHKSRRH